MIDYTFEKNVLIIGDNSLHFEHSIRMVKETSELLIVLLEIPFDKDDTENVFAVNLAGKIVWRVQNAREVFEVKQHLPYEHMRFDEEGRIVVSNFYGVTYTIDPNDGQVLQRGVTK